MPLPILYTFRRCPYAIRARLGLLLGQRNVEIREITLKAKPDALLQASPKGTVPVLVLGDGQVISESLEIMRWALSSPHPQADACPPLLGQTVDEQTLIAHLIHQNDHEFKPWLDKYKYADRYPAQSQTDYFLSASAFLNTLEIHLNRHRYLIDDQLSFADYAIVPFIRQFNAVDPKRDLNLSYPRLMVWLTELTSSEIFTQAMNKYVIWEAGQSPISLLGSNVSE
ncbi:glutathione S-transferase [Shewanella sp. KJ2020]|uniref:glutathione S-transferase n=1 Tax=Shewanella sp. KJ2020 TaxID=2919172 RepID=UPI0020A72867|nr:glutathione S-transferase [Shewanella sp. KJ2020]MCP3126994.1 glutathione S-transferase [Shewanella sp. KJ2020]